MEKVVRVFNSFEEAENAERRHRAAMTPQQRLEAFFELRERFNWHGDPERLARLHSVPERTGS